MKRSQQGNSSNIFYYNIHMYYHLNKTFHEKGIQLLTSCSGHEQAVDKFNSFNRNTTYLKLLLVYKSTHVAFVKLISE